jgi:hypothetical protein
MNMVGLLLISGLLAPQPPAFNMNGK